MVDINQLYACPAITLRVRVGVKVGVKVRVKVTHVCVFMLCMNR